MAQDGDRDSAQADRIAELIDELDAAAFDDRRAAQEALIGIGEPARAALEEAAESGNAEMAARARRVLDELAERAFKASAERFIRTGEGLGEVSLPGYKAYKRAAGESEAARRLYVWIYRARRGLLREAEKAAGIASSRWAEPEAVEEARRAFLQRDKAEFERLKTEYKREVSLAKADGEPGYKGYELSEARLGQIVGQMLALKIVPDAWVSDRLIEVAQLTNLGLSLGQQTKRSGWAPMTRWLTSDAPEAEAGQALFRSLARSARDAKALERLLGVAMFMRDRALSLDLARGMIARKEQMSEHGRFLALHTIMLWGEKDKDIQRALPFLDSAEERRPGGFRGQPPRKTVKFAELALMALRRMTEGGPADKDAEKGTVYCAAARWVSVYFYLDPEKLRAETKKWRNRYGAEEGDAADGRVDGGRGEAETGR